MVGEQITVEEIDPKKSGYADDWTKDNRLDLPCVGLQHLSLKADTVTYYCELCEEDFIFPARFIHIYSEKHKMAFMVRQHYLLTLTA